LVSISKGLFADLLAQEGIFQSRDVLRSTYTPSELPHREEQINNLASVLVPALRGETALMFSSMDKPVLEKPP